MTTSGCVRAASVERRLTGRGEFDLVAAGPEVGRECAQDLRLVVDDEDAGHVGALGSRSDDR